jgi:hypothetical protein
MLTLFIKASLQLGHFRKDSRKNRAQMDRPCLLSGRAHFGQGSPGKNRLNIATSTSALHFYRETRPLLEQSIYVVNCVREWGARWRPMPTSLGIIGNGTRAFESSPMT